MLVKTQEQAPECGHVLAYKVIAGAVGVTHLLSCSCCLKWAKKASELRRQKELVGARRVRYVFLGV